MGRTLVEDLHYWKTEYHIPSNLLEKAAAAIIEAEQQVAALKQDLQLARHESERNIAVCSEANRAAESTERQVLVLRGGLKESLTCLRELYATVKGESPSLLNEDSGGNGMLDIRILDALDLSSLLKAPPTEKKP